MPFNETKIDFPTQSEKSQSEVPTLINMRIPPGVSLTEREKLILEKLNQEIKSDDSRVFSTEEVELMKRLAEANPSISVPEEDLAAKERRAEADREFKRSREESEQKRAEFRAELRRRPIVDLPPEPPEEAPIFDASRLQKPKQKSLWARFASWVGRG